MDSFKNVILSEAQIKSNVEQIAKEIDQMYEGRAQEFVMIMVLNGAIYFGADLSKQIKTPHQIECIRVSSYGNGTESGNVKVIDNVRLDLQGKHILIVDEILDTGKTLDTLCKMFASEGAASVNVCVLMEKAMYRQYPVAPCNTTTKVDPKNFLVGYGLDYRGLHRNLRKVVNIV